MHKTIDRVGVLFVILMVGSATAFAGRARAEQPVWDLSGKATSGAGERLDGNFLIQFRISECREYPSQSWTISRYVRVAKGVYSSAIRAEDFLPAGSAMPRGCRVSAQAPAGAPWRLGRPRLETRSIMSEAERHEYERELRRLRAGLAEDNPEPEFRDALNPEPGSGDNRLRKVLSEESKLLDQRLERSLRTTDGQ